MTDKPTHENLLATHGTTPATKLPDDPATAEIADHGRERFVEIVRQHPESSLCWALLAEGALNLATPDADVNAYAYARTGYHRGLDQLRKAGWKGQGPIPWEHGPNRGFLRCLWALAVAAHRIGEQAEAERCAQFLRDSSFKAYDELTDSRPMEAKTGNEKSDAEDQPAADQDADEKAASASDSGNDEDRGSIG